MNCLARLRFVGTAYHGTQIQNNGLTVQGVFQEALGRIFGARPDIKCCSRLDVGVHANAFYISFPAPDGERTSVLLRSVNALLPRDIRVADIRKVAETFHARYSATGKRYVYRIVNSPVMDPFEEGRAAQVVKYIDVKTLHETAQVFVGTHDFRAFTKTNAALRGGTEKTLTGVEARRDGELVIICMTGTGFLYHMARSIAGTLVNAAAGRIDRDGIVERIENGSRDRLIATAPACGLYLDEVFYPADSWRDDE